MTDTKVAASAPQPIRPADTLGTPSDAPSGTLPVVPREYLLPFALLISLFALWGLANNLNDVLLATFRRIMSMSDFQTSWIQVAFYGSYFCLALPAAFFIRRFTYKAGILLGLGLFAIGALLFYPASQTMVYGHFLVALFILAAGLSFLETSANPYVVVLGPEETATRRLNLAQAFNPLGSIIGVVIGKVFILQNLNQANAAQRARMSPGQLAHVQHAELAAVMNPYVCIAVVIVVFWIAIAIARFPPGSDAGALSSVGDSFRRIFRRKHYTSGVVAQFFYVGAQIGMWSFTIRYVMVNLHLQEAGAATYYLASIVVFSMARFVFTALMKFIAPHLLLLWAALLAVALLAVVIFVGGLPGAWAVVGVSGCMSLMFPTIYGLALHGLGEDTKIGGAGLVMAILGGAVLTSVQGRASDAWGIQASFVVPAVCFVVIAYFALRGYRPDASGAARPLAARAGA
ncbi:MAG TPA: L-fucose:H+ symporter permease [Longimicrobiaceae bacterium]|nr:L-fucose:H+ symporter permease [Longimicrobiaceae bacterium]